jgi:hypothetical protein
MGIHGKAIERRTLRERLRVFPMVATRAEGLDGTPGLAKCTVSQQQPTTHAE